MKTKSDRLPSSPSKRLGKFLAYSEYIGDGHQLQAAVTLDCNNTAIGITITRRRESVFEQLYVPRASIRCLREAVASAEREMKIADADFAARPGKMGKLGDIPRR